MAVCAGALCFWRLILLAMNPFGSLDQAYDSATSPGEGGFEFLPYHCQPNVDVKSLYVVHGMCVASCSLDVEFFQCAWLNVMFRDMRPFELVQQDNQVCNT